MPFTLRPISRRRFLAGSLAAGLSLAAARHLRAAGAGASADPNRLVLFSDTHIESGRGRSMWWRSSMSDNLDAAVAAVLRLDPPPAHAIVNGDCAYGTGRPGDYQCFLDGLKPLRGAGVPIHLALGNHDHRENFWNAIPDEHRRARPVADRQITMFSTPHADVYLLDSLEKTDGVPGRLGLDQLAWLTQSLDERPHRPAIVFSHHQPDLRPKPRGLLDTTSLMNVIAYRPQVKLHVFGHTHRFSVYPPRADGLHRVNLPPLGYVFHRDDPLGWVDLRVSADSATLTLNCLNVQHPLHGQTTTLRWRS